MEQQQQLLFTPEPGMMNRSTDFSHKGWTVHLTIWAQIAKESIARTEA